MHNQVNERDWKLFRERISGWQEAYMEKLNQEYIALLSGEGSASDRFWGLERRVWQDKRSSGVVVQMRRSMMRHNLLSLLEEQVITLDDLDGFSDSLVSDLTHMQEQYYEDI